MEVCSKDPDNTDNTDKPKTATLSSLTSDTASTTREHGLLYSDPMYPGKQRRSRILHLERRFGSLASQLP